MSLEALKWILGILFSGWILYLSAERARVVGDIKEIQKKANEAFTKAETLATLVHAVFLTKEEHRDFDNRISASIDRLTNRIDQILQKN
jgi:hypothetical protein